VKLIVRSPGQLPYGGKYSLNLPELGIVGWGQNYFDLKERVEAWRHANGWPVGLGFDEELQAAVCRDYPAECTIELPPALPAPQKIGWGDVMRGTVMMAKNKLAGSPTVSDEEANRRAEICARCILRSDYTSPCPLCKDLENLAVSMVGARTTKFDGRLQRKACAICHCFLGASVWVDLDLQWSVLSDEQKEQFWVAHREIGCWKCPTT